MRDAIQIDSCQSSEASDPAPMVCRGVDRQRRIGVWTVERRESLSTVSRVDLGRQQLTVCEELTPVGAIIHCRLDQILRFFRCFHRSQTVAPAVSESETASETASESATFDLHILR